MENLIQPSYHQNLGKFTIDTHVTFTIHGKPQTGTISKQLKNSAVVEIDETDENANSMTQSKGVVIIEQQRIEEDLTLTISMLWDGFLLYKKLRKTK